MSPRSLKLRNSEQLSQELAYRYALKLLTGRDYTTLKLREKLRAREFPDSVAESAVARLTIEGWVNDRRFAERFAESAVSSQRFFGPRLKMEMRRRGISAELVDEVFVDICEEYDEGEGARTLLEKHFPEFSLADAADKEKRRVIAFLQRRGCSYSTIMKSMRKMD